MSLFRKRSFWINKDEVKKLTAEWTAGTDPVVTLFIDKTEVAQAHLEEMKRGIQFTTPSGAKVEVFAFKGIPRLHFGVIWNGKTVHGSMNAKWVVNFLGIYALLLGVMGLAAPFLYPHVRAILSTSHLVFARTMDIAYIYIAFHIFKKSLFALKAFTAMLAAGAIYGLPFTIRSFRQNPDLMGGLFMPIGMVFVAIGFINFFWVAIQYLEAQQAAKSQRDWV